MADAVRTRLPETVTATIALDANLSGEIDMSGKAGLIVHMPAAWTAASIGFKVASYTGGTFQPLYDDDGNLIQIDSPSASKSYVAPASLFPARFVCLWSQDGSGNNTAQEAARSLVVDLKP
jgi:hypothetical protein